MEEDNYVKIIASLKDLIKEYSDFIDEGNKALEHYCEQSKIVNEIVQPKKNGLMDFVNTLTKTGGVPQ